MRLIQRFPLCCAFLPEAGERDTAAGEAGRALGRDERRSRAGQRGVLDYQADFHGQFSTLCAFYSPFMRAEGFLDAFRC